MAATGPTYRAGIIGCGSIGSSMEDGLAGFPGRIFFPYSHAGMYRAVARTELVAGADSHPARLAAFGKRWGVDNLYADYHEMLEKERLDIVSVATPVRFHARVVADAARAGVRGILCEKPLTTSLGDAEAMIAACAEHGVKLAVNHWRRTDQFYLQARDLIASGKIGSLKNIVATWAGMVLDVGTHMIDAINFFNGDADVAWLIADVEKDGPPSPFAAFAADAPPPDPGISAYVQYTNGMHVFLSGSAYNSVGFRLDLAGPDGHLVIGGNEPEWWRVNPESPYRELLKHPFPLVADPKAPMVGVLADLIDAVEQGREPVCSGKLAKRALEVILAIHDSARQGNQKITFPYQNRDLDALAPGLVGAKG